MNLSSFIAFTHLSFTVIPDSIRIQCIMYKFRVESGMTGTAKVPGFFEVVNSRHRQNA
jgi:hypothetical protein